MPGTNTSGFTLVELILTVAILSIVSAIAVPAYKAYILEAEIGRAIKDIHQIEIMIIGYDAEGTFPDSLDEVGAGNMLDPWGQPYAYLNIADADKAAKGKVRKDKFLVPVNSDFDLYSIGPDGKTATAFTSKNSRDDVVRANNGGFVGLARDY